MFNDLLSTGTSQFRRFDVLRQVREQNTDIGGVTITSTAVFSTELELQHLRGDEPLGEGGLRIEANYRGYVRDDMDIRESDVLTPDSGVTRYEVKFVQNLFDEHIEFFAQKVD